MDPEDIDPPLSMFRSLRISRNTISSMINKNRDEEKLTTVLIISANSESHDKIFACHSYFIIHF